jgi:hypothetical protein
MKKKKKNQQISNWTICTQIRKDKYIPREKGGTILEALKLPAATASGAADGRRKGEQNEARVFK